VETLSDRDEFLELTAAYGVVSVVRVGSEALRLVLRRELSPEEMRYVRRLAQDWWGPNQFVSLARADARTNGASGLSEQEDFFTVEK
jgi:hypothetical protein